MKEIEITLDKDRIITEVRRVTAYEGYRGGGSDEAFVKMFVRKEDEETLERFYAEAYERVRATANEYIIDEPIDTSASVQVLTLGMPDNYKSTLASTMEQLANQYMVESIAADWYGLVEKENEAQHSSTAGEALASLRSMLHKRNRPKRPSN